LNFTLSREGAELSVICDALRALAIGYRLLVIAKLMRRPARWRATPGMGWKRLSPAGAVKLEDEVAAGACLGNL
jgi:hypothetical protein